VPVLGVAMLLLGLRFFVGVGYYAGENERLLNSLPKVPGAERMLTQNSVSAGEGGLLTVLSQTLGGAAANGWTTRWEFHAPAGTTASRVLQRYETEMVAAGWTVSERCCGDASSIVNFTRGEQSVSVNADNLGVGRYEVAVDVHAARTHRKEIGQ
jgi:hypothetical protein